jgi:hypothetical protein
MGSGDVGSGVGCPVCATGAASLGDLARHLVEAAEASEPRHVMWLNRRVTKTRCDADTLLPLLEAALEGREASGAARVRR